jgi:hypothetical protein
MAVVARDDARSAETASRDDADVATTATARQYGDGADLTAPKAAAGADPGASGIRIPKPRGFPRRDHRHEPSAPYVPPAGRIGAEIGPGAGYESIADSPPRPFGHNAVKRRWHRSPWTRIDSVNRQDAQQRAREKSQDHVKQFLLL